MLLFLSLILAWLTSFASFRFLVNKAASILSTSKLILFCRPHSIASSPTISSVLVVSHIELSTAIIPISSAKDKVVIGIFASI